MQTADLIANVISKIIMPLRLEKETVLSSYGYVLMRMPIHLKIKIIILKGICL